MPPETPKEKSNGIVQDTINALAELKSLTENASDFDGEGDAERDVTLEYKMREAKEKIKAAELEADNADNTRLLELMNAIEAMPQTADGKTDELKEEGERLSAKIRTKITPPTPEAPTPVPERQKTFIENMSERFEQFQNMIAKNLAPILESLQEMGISFLGGFLSILGMNRVLIFSALHKNGIDIELSEDPKKDRKAINSITGLALDLHSISSSYQTKTFFEAVALDFSKKNNVSGRKFTLEDIADFAANNENLLQTQRSIAENLRKTSPNTPAPAAAPSTTPPSAPAATPPATPTPTVPPAPAKPE